MHPPVLITTSGIGSRLGDLTTYTNKSLVKLGDKYAICHIIEHYPENTEFVITVGYFGEHVRQFLKLAYPIRNFTFVEVDNYSGVGSSLGYSLLKANYSLNRPFVFHCCDSVILDKPIDYGDSNVLFVAKRDTSIHYTNILVHNNLVTCINPKGHTDFDYVYTGVSYIYDFSLFWNHLERIYVSNPNFKQLSDVDAIRCMMAFTKFQYSRVYEYFDTGNIASYTYARSKFEQKFTVLDKSYESICFLNDKVIKFVNDVELNKKRILRGKDLYPLTPKILDSSQNFISMERVEGTLLSETYESGEVYRLLNWAKTNLWIEKSVHEDYRKSCYEFYLTKTISRISKLPFVVNEANNINGLAIKPIFQLLKDIDIEKLCTNTFTKFHGDFILDNIIKRDDSYCLLDWRHEFDTQIKYGDLYYDLSKLMHNIVFNHKNISDKLFHVSYTNGKCLVDLKCNYFLVQQLDDFNRFATEQNFDIKKIKILTAIIWLNMSPLYETPLREFLFYFGKYNLALCVNQARP
jgi:choline kinase